MSFLFSAGAVDVIPDSGMFQSPIYQWNAKSFDLSNNDTISEWADGLSDITASAVGAPVYSADQSGKEAVVTDGSDDAFDFSPDSSLPTGSDPFSIAVTIYLESGDDETITYWGEDSQDQSNGLQVRDGLLGHFFFANDLKETSVATNQFVTLGVRYDGNNRKLYYNGNPDVSDSPGSVNVADSNHSLLYEKARDRGYSDGYTHDIIISDVAESDQAFSDYHNDRLG